MIVYNMSYLLDACLIGQTEKKCLKSQTLRKVVSEFIQSESPFEPHPRFFYDTHCDLDFFNLITGHLM